MWWVNFDLLDSFLKIEICSFFTLKALSEGVDCRAASHKCIQGMGLNRNTPLIWAAL